ncbi:MAG: transcriptional regulator [Betaproteobacteria bacterium HGW-Betaproteobacteria-11]|nr:MAG: transcriptional regulator [Betaproteobacteria bacterium HGW-Betaproteobacteria-11]
MTTDRPADYLVSLVRELCKLPQETEWAEFKENDAEPPQIGEYLSALSNSAALAGKAFAYLVWGIRDGDHAVVGTGFSPATAKVGNEELENWLLRSLAPKIHFRFFAVTVDGLPVVVLEIERAFRQPVQFQGQEFIRVGTYKKRLKDFPEKERALWRLFDKAPFENGVAAERVRDEDVLRLLDYPAYFDLLGRALPENRAGILAALEDDKLIVPCEVGGWNITNLGAVLFAKRLDDFASLKRKAMRVIQYRDKSRADGGKEQVGGKGYASGFEGLIAYVNGLLPTNEVIGQALRRDVPMYPELAIRELVANALIHQDFFMSGVGPMVEIFEDRIEITNPGIPLVSTDRFVDTPPRSRNEGLASLMRRIGICEERGSGIDKVIRLVEAFQLPAPIFEVPDGFTRSVLFAHRPLARMDKADRIRAVYQHACLRYVNRLQLTNASLRERFGIEPANKAAASRLIRDALEAGVIRLVNEDVGDKLRAYVPHWA